MALLTESEKSIYFELVRLQRAQGNLEPLMSQVEKTQEGISSEVGNVNRSSMSLFG